MIIYKVVNLANNKSYIGQTRKTLNRRRNEHHSFARTGSETAFHRALRKYGEDGFKWDIIDRTTTLDNLNLKEQYWIAHYNSFGENGYNMTSGGEGYVVSEKTKDKISKSKNGQPFLVFNKHTREFIGEFTNKAKTGIHLKVGSGRIVECLNETRDLVSTGDYVFIYKHSHTPQKMEEIFNSVRTRNEYEPIVCIDKNTKQEYRYNSKEDVLKNIEGLTRQDLNNCLSGNKTSARDHCFIYEGEYTREKVLEMCKKTLSRRDEPFVGYDLNWNIIGEWDTKAQASRDLGVDSRRISEYLLGQRGIVDNKYQFVYLSEVEDMLVTADNEVKMVK